MGAVGACWYVGWACGGVTVTVVVVAAGLVGRGDRMDAGACPAEMVGIVACVAAVMAGERVGAMSACVGVVAIVPLVIGGRGMTATGVDAAGAALMVARIVDRPAAGEIDAESVMGSSRAGR